MAIFRDLKPSRELVDTIPHARGRNGHIGISRRGSPPTWREAKRRQDKGFHSVLLSFWGPWLHFTRIAVWALGAGYFWIVTIDILVNTRRTGTGWRHAMGVSILIRMLPITNRIVFVNEHASVLLKNVDYLLIAKPVLQLTTWRSAATEWPLGVLPVVGSLHWRLWS